MKIFGDTHIGEVRKSNQDSFRYRILSPDLLYAVVCDGMGGERGGQVASQTAVEIIGNMLGRDIGQASVPGRSNRCWNAPWRGPMPPSMTWARRKPELKGMGTTIVAAVVLGATVYLLSAGDSRAYRYSKGEVSQLTRDHTVVQLLLERGEITPDEAKTHPQRHYITRALGVEPTLATDYMEYTLRPGELLLICSDGLYNYVGEQQLPSLLEECGRLGAVDPLIDAANRGGGGDNITAVVIAQEREEANCRG